MWAASDRITAVYPRIQGDIEYIARGEVGRGTLIALDPAVDDVGVVNVVEGEYETRKWPSCHS